MSTLLIATNATMMGIVVLLCAAYKRSIADRDAKISDLAEMMEEQLVLNNRLADELIDSMGRLLKANSKIVELRDTLAAERRGQELTNIRLTDISSRLN